ncbi:MAG: hypothetical protein HZC55_21450 [Verrucomicrobia bacterium]|nr:hypothetical protein [Verrucomicrobiota bacterium]
MSLRFATWSSLLALQAFALLLFHQQWPRVGHDLSTFLPRMVDVYLHYRCNGLSLQWWTPSLGGGLPAFPNPEHTQFMLGQFLLFLTDPWSASLLNFLLPLALGFLLVVKFCRDFLDWSAEAALVAAAVFSTNNFGFYHAFSGHVGYATFPLVALLPFCLHRRTAAPLAIALLAAGAAVIAMTGGYAIIVIFALSALLLAPALAWHDPTAFPWKRSVGVLIGGAALALLAAAAKICAVALYLGQFPREVSYSHPAADFLPAIGSLAAQLFAAKPVFLLQWLVDLDPATLFARLAGPEVEDAGVSPVALVLVPLGCLPFFRNWSPARCAAAVATGLALWIASEFTLGRGLLWPHLQPLPFLRSMHANSRYAAAFLLPVALLSGLGVELLRSRLRPAMFRTTAAAAVLVSLASLVTFRRQMNSLWFAGFDAIEIQRVWTEVRAGESFRPITTIADVREDRVFAARASNLKPYEPIFGYGYPGPAFRSQLHPGPILAPGADGTLNFNFPLAFVAPDLAGARPFARFSDNRLPDLQLLLDRRQPDWPLPLVQRIANVLSVAGWLAIGATAVSQTTFFRRP